MDSSEKLILKTLLYFDIFNFPLTQKEIWQFLISKKIKNQQMLSKFLKNSNLKFYKSFYFLSNKKEVEDRIRNEKLNNLKLRKAVKVINILSKIPTINLIGISGSLSMKNSKLEDDIDLFMICEKDSIWATRLLSVIILIALGVYRNRNDKQYQDKICLNFIIGSNNLKFNKAEQNLYLAHEIVQLLPIMQRENFYYQLLSSNKWIKKYLPNYKDRVSSYKLVINENKGLMDSFLLRLIEFSRLEKISKFLQWNYMKGKITREQVNNNMLAFHPVDYGKIVLDLYKKKISQSVL